MVHHPGNNDGFSLELSFLPQDSVGVVVLTNLYNTTLRDFLPLLIYDRMLGLPRVDWTARFRDRAARSRAAATLARARDDSARVPSTHPSHALDAYVGTYSHPAYGDMIVTREGESLRLGFGVYQFPLEHVHYDVFRLVLPRGDPTYNRFRMRLSFLSGPDGGVATLLAPVEPSMAPLAFVRRKG